MYSFKDKGDIEDIVYLLKKSKIGMAFNTNVLRIALNFDEEKIASVLVADFKVQMEEEMILRAIKTKQMYFIYCVFAFNKNY